MIYREQLSRGLESDHTGIEIFQRIADFPSNYQLESDHTGIEI